MSQHLIEYVARDRTGITAVVTPTGVVDVDTVLRHLDAGHAGYYVAADGWRRVRVFSRRVLGSDYLYANWDGSKRNNLHDLAFHAPTVAPVRQAPESRVAQLLTALFGRVPKTPQR